MASKPCTGPQHEKTGFFFPLNQEDSSSLREGFSEGREGFLFPGPLKDRLKNQRIQVEGSPNQLDYDKTALVTNYSGTTMLKEMCLHQSCLFPLQSHLRGHT